MGKNAEKSEMMDRSLLTRSRSAKNVWVAPICPFKLNVIHGWDTLRQAGVQLRCASNQNSVLMNRVQ